MLNYFKISKIVPCLEKNMYYCFASVNQHTPSMNRRLEEFVYVYAHINVCNIWTILLFFVKQRSTKKIQSFYISTMYTRTLLTALIGYFISFHCYFILFYFIHLSFASTKMSPHPWSNRRKKTSVVVPPPITLARA